MTGKFSNLNLIKIKKVFSLHVSQQFSIIATVFSLAAEELSYKTITRKWSYANSSCDTE